MKQTEKYYKQVEYIESIANIESSNYMKKHDNPIFYLKRLNYFLKFLGNPHKKLKNYIQIGGTSGKGSTATYLHNILVQSGNKTGLFTSPFLTETIEKYKINNKLISQKDFIKIVDKLKPAINSCAQYSRYGVPSYFEICFAIACIYFSKNKCKYNIFEVGCGGEFDATNIVKNKIVTAITHVDLDHTEILGNTYDKIATTKSKIISKNSIFFTTENRPNLRNIFKKECARNNAIYNYIKPITQKINFNNNKIEFIYKNNRYSSVLIGQHQVTNAILAIEIAKYLNIELIYIKKGIKSTKIPARFEILKEKPYIIFDVAHNPDKFKSTLDNIGLLRFKNLNIVYASAANKDLQKIAKLIAPFTNNLYITRFLLTQRKCADPKKVLKYWKKYNPKIKSRIYLDPDIALKEAIKKTKISDLLLVCGSFFLCGRLRKKYYDSLKILRTRKVI